MVVRHPPKRRAHYQADVGRRPLAIAEAVVHQDDRMGRGRMGRRDLRDGRDRRQGPHEGPKEGKDAERGEAGHGC